MPTLFPIVLDSFLNPSSSTTLDASGSNPSLRHHIQHTNINDAVKAIQDRVGVTGSNVSTTIDYELHNVNHGHDHDGINSRPVALGIDCDDGLFTFNAFTRAGEAICDLNKVLKSLAPKPAPDLINIGVADTGVAGILSFGSSQGIVGYTNVSGTGSLPAANINTSYSVSVFSGDLRRGLFNPTTTINGILNDSTVANLPNYPADAFGNADQGIIIMDLNGTTVITMSLIPTTAITSSTTNGSFVAVSVLRTGSFPNGDSFDLFKHRTGVWSVSPSDQRNGWNFVKIIHDISGNQTITNYVEWVVDNNPVAPTAPSGSLHTINLTGLKYLTGIKYYTGGTALYTTKSGKNLQFKSLSGGIVCHC
jgi:hypothetical protein